MTTLIVCLTVLAVAALIAWTAVALAVRRAQWQRDVAMHQRQAAAPVAELADATRALVAAAQALERCEGARGPSRVGHRVTVHTKRPDDQTIFGVIVGDYLDRVALEDAEYVVASGVNQSLPGRQDIASADIAWIDVHAHVSAAAGAAAAAGEV